MLQKMVIVLILSIGLLGCGKENADISNTEEVESVQDNSEIAVEEIDTKEESSVENAETEEDTEIELEQNTDTNPMVDWETFAAQEDNEEICLVVYNETTKTQKVMGLNEEEKDPVGGAYIYQIQAGDKFAVPIRDNIVKIWIDDTEQHFNQEAPYLEIELPKEEICQIYVTTYGAEDSKHFVLQE